MHILGIHIFRTKFPKYEQAPIYFNDKYVETDKLIPLIIEKSKIPGCFGNFSHEKHTDYYFNQKSWMNLEIFNGFLMKWDAKLKKEKSKNSPIY